MVHVIRINLIRINCRAPTKTDTALRGLQISPSRDAQVTLSTTICPWCYFGKKRLEKAITPFEEEVRVRWLPFQLNPTMPKEGISRKEYRVRKFGSWERSLELDAKVIAVGETEGIHFAFDRIERTPNTADAHRLIWIADQQGCQDTIVEALFQAFCTGRSRSSASLSRFCLER